MAMLVLIMLPGILLVIPCSCRWSTSAGPTPCRPWCCLGLPCRFLSACTLMRTFFETLPREYFEAASPRRRLGRRSCFCASPCRWRMPAFSTLGILTLLFTWNDIIWPLIVLLDTTTLPDRHRRALVLQCPVDQLRRHLCRLYAGLTPSRRRLRLHRAPLYGRPARRLPLERTPFREAKRPSNRRLPAPSSRKGFH